jgi:hypothetical protein
MIFSTPRGGSVLKRFDREVFLVVSKQVNGI